jgi:hypothetical protein
MISEAALLFAFDHHRLRNIFGGHFSQLCLRLNVGQTIGVRPAFGGLISQIGGAFGHRVAVTHPYPRSGGQYCSLWRSKFAGYPSSRIRFQRVLDHSLKYVLALRTFKGPQIGAVRTRFDAGQHHAALTLWATWPFDGK